MGSILVARELPPVGGDTLFASMGAAYDALSDGLKETLASLRAVHSSDHIYQPGGYYAKSDLAAEMRGQDLSTRAVHPVVIRHPVTGRKLLYVNGAFTLHFEGWTREESLPLLQYLYQVASREEYQCRLHWEPGSVAIWDNRSTWHLAMNDYQGHRRVMHRITLSGEPLAA
jgi:taurine dioxygenase